MYKIYILLGALMIQSLYPAKDFIVINKTQDIFNIDAYLTLDLLKQLGSKFQISQLYPNSTVKAALPKKFVETENGLLMMDFTRPKSKQLIRFKLGVVKPNNFGDLVITIKPNDMKGTQFDTSNFIPWVSGFSLEKEY